MCAVCTKQGKRFSFFSSVWLSLKLLSSFLISFEELPLTSEFVHLLTWTRRCCASTYFTITLMVMFNNSFNNCFSILISYNFLAFHLVILFVDLHAIALFSSILPTRNMKPSSIIFFLSVCEILPCIPWLTKG